MRVRVYYRKMNIEEPWTFSDGWPRNFILPQGIRRMKICCEKNSSEESGAEKYITTKSELVSEHNLSAEQLYDADETGLIWCILPNTTLVHGCELHAPGYKRSKERLAVLCCTTAADTHWCKLFVEKSLLPRAFKVFKSLPIICKVHRNAW